MESPLTFTSFIHFEFIFVSGVSQWSSFPPLHVAVQRFQWHLWRRLVFFPVDGLSGLVEYMVLTRRVEGPLLDSSSVPLVAVSVFVPVPHCLGEHSFAAQPEIRHCAAPRCGFLGYYSRGHSGSFLIPHKSSDDLFQLSEESPWYF